MPVPVKLSGVIPSQGRYQAEKLSSVLRVPAGGVPNFTGATLVPGCLTNPVSNQGGESSCVANAICDGLEIAQIAKGHPLVQLSRNALYYWSRCRHGAQNQDAGTHIPLALEQATLVGVIPEERWPYIESRVDKAPTNDEILLASENQVSGFFEIEGEGEHVAQQMACTLMVGHPIIAAFWLGPEYRSMEPGQIARVPGSRWGLHAQLIVGFRTSVQGELEFLIRNSWGPEWGDSGHIWASQSYVCDPRYVFDRYAFVTNKEFSWP